MVRDDSSLGHPVHPIRGELAKRRRLQRIIEIGSEYLENFLRLSYKTFMKIVRTAMTLSITSRLRYLLNGEFSAFTHIFDVNKEYRQGICSPPHLLESNQVYNRGYKGYL